MMSPVKQARMQPCSYRFATVGAAIRCIMLFSAIIGAEKYADALPLTLSHRGGGRFDYRMQRARGGEDIGLARSESHHRQGHFLHRRNCAAVCKVPQYSTAAGSKPCRFYQSESPTHVAFASPPRRRQGGLHRVAQKSSGRIGHGFNPPQKRQSCRQ